MKTNQYTFIEKKYADEFQQYCEKELLTTKRFSETEVSVAIYENELESIDIADDKYYDIKIEMLIASIEAYMSESPAILCRDSQRRKSQLEGLEMAKKQVNKVIAAYRTDKDINKFLKTLNRFANKAPEGCGRWAYYQGWYYITLQKKAGLREILQDLGFEDYSECE